MLIRFFGAFAIAASAGVLFTSTADASPRFTVHNDTEGTVKVIIYSGNDSACSLEEKTKTISSGKSNTYGCAGHGKGRCKIRMKYKSDVICKSHTNTCDGKSTKIDDGGAVTVSQNNNDISCSFEN